MKPSQAIDHLATVCDAALRRGESRDHVGSHGAALKLWRFMRPEEPSRLSSAQHHTAARLVTWAEQRLNEENNGDPANRKDLSSAISIAAEALRDEPPPQQSRPRARYSRK